MLARWRREIDQPATAETPRIKPPPQPITAPSRGFKLTGGLFVALVLAAIVVVFVGYVGLQLVRFTQNPEIALNGPSIRQLQPGAGAARAERHRRRPTPSSRPPVPDELVRTTTAERARAPGRSTCRSARAATTSPSSRTDPETARESEPLQVIATVPVLDVIGAGCRGAGPA